MAYLRIFSGDAPPDQLELSLEKISIGRVGENDIVLKSKGVSKCHAIVEKTGHAYILTDNDSANGVYVNGQRIHRHTLRHWLVKDPDLALQVLNHLASQGISISIDDFGTGYSSLAYLRKMSASELKIDKAFVAEMLTSESDAAIVQATIDLAHNLGLKVVAEGVENAETARALAQLKCDSLQGFHFCPPLPSDQVDNWLVSRNVHSIWGRSRLKSVR